VTKLFGELTFPPNLGWRTLSSQKVLERTELVMCTTLGFRLWDGSPHLYFRKELDSDDYQSQYFGSSLLDLCLFQDKAYTHPETVGCFVADLVKSLPDLGEEQRKFLEMALQIVYNLSSMSREPWMVPLEKKIKEVLKY